MVNNYGANQFVLSVHGLTYHTTGIAAGIGDNSLSSSKSWIFQYTVSQGTFTDVKLYVLIDEYTVGEECAGIVSRIASIIDDAYGDFMRAMWA